MNREVWPNMYTRLHSLPLWPIVLLALWPGYPPALARAQPADEANWKDRFLSEAPAGWTRYAAGAAHLQGRCTSKTVVHRSDGTSEQFGGASEVKQASGCALHSDQAGGNDDRTETLSAANPQYQFELKRKSPSDPWLVTNISAKPETKSPSDPLDLSPFGFVRRSLYAPIVLSSTDAQADLEWPALVTNPLLHLRSVAPIQQNGKELVQVEFSIDWSASAEHLRTIKGGQATFDPALDWVMTACQFQLDAWIPLKKAVFTTSIVDSYEYTVGKNNFPLLSRVIIREESPGKDYHAETQADYALEPGDAPQSAFRLSAYGFPEPEGPATRPWWSLWAIGASLVCIAAAGVCWWFLRRKAPKPAP